MPPMSPPTAGQSGVGVCASTIAKPRNATNSSTARRFIPFGLLASQLWQRERNQRVGGRAAQESTAARGNDDVLFTVAAHVGGRHRMSRRIDRHLPELCAAARVECTELAVDRG